MSEWAKFWVQIIDCHELLHGSTIVDVGFSEQAKAGVDSKYSKK